MLFLPDVGEGGILLEDHFGGIADPRLQLGASRAVIDMVSGREAAGLDQGELDIVGKGKALRRHPKFNIHLPEVPGKGIEDIIGGADDCQLAEIVSELLVEETPEAHSERSDIPQHPEVAGVLDKRERVVDGGRCVVGFLHSVFGFGPQ